MQFRYKLCSRYFSLSSHAFLLKTRQLPVLSHKKQLIFNIFTVKMSEKCFVQTKNKKKTIAIEVNFLLSEKFHFEFNQFEFIHVNFPQKTDGGGDGKELLSRLPAEEDGLVLPREETPLPLPSPSPVLPSEASPRFPPWSPHLRSS